MPLHVRLVGGGLGTTLRISIWLWQWIFFCGNVPVFIHVHGAVLDGMGTRLWNKFIYMVMEPMGWARH